MGEREQFQTVIDEQLERWNTQLENHVKKIEELKIKADQLESEGKHRFLVQIKDLENKLHHLKHQLNEGQARLDEFKDAGEDAWKEVKAGGKHAWDDLVVGANKAWDEIKTSFDQATSKIEDRIPPKTGQRK